MNINKYHINYIYNNDDDLKNYMNNVYNLSLEKKDVILEKFECDDNECKNKRLIDDLDDIEKICKDYDKVPHIFPAVNRIIAIGDIHGDLDLCKEYLKVGKVIDDNMNWIGGDTVVVQVGDQVDRCRPMPGKKCRDENNGKAK